MRYELRVWAFVNISFSPNFPVVNRIQPFYYKYSDAFVTKLNPSGTALDYSTYPGGELIDSARGMALDASGNAYVTGSIDSFEFQTTPGAFQIDNAGGISNHTDAFIARIGGAIAPPSLPSLMRAEISRIEGNTRPHCSTSKPASLLQQVIR